MIHINAIQRLPESRSEVEKPLRLEIAFDAKNADEMANALFLLATSISDIVNSVKEPSGHER